MEIFIDSQWINPEEEAGDARQKVNADDSRPGAEVASTPPPPLPVGTTRGEGPGVEESTGGHDIAPYPVYCQASSPVVADDWEPNPSWAAPEGRPPVLPRSRVTRRRWCSGCGDEVIATCQWCGLEVCENHQDRDCHPWGGSGTIPCIHGPSPSANNASTAPLSTEEGWEVPQEERCETPYLSDDSELEQWDAERRKQRRRPNCRPRFGPDGSFAGVTPIDGRVRHRVLESGQGAGTGISSSSDDSGFR